MFKRTAAGNCINYFPALNFFWFFLVQLKAAAGWEKTLSIASTIVLRDDENLWFSAAFPCRDLLFNEFFKLFPFFIWAFRRLNDAWRWLSLSTSTPTLGSGVREPRRRQTKGRPQTLRNSFSINLLFIYSNCATKSNNREWGAKEGEVCSATILF